MTGTPGKDDAPSLVSFTVEGAPVSQPRHRISVRMKNGRVVLSKGRPIIDRSLPTVKGPLGKNLPHPVIAWRKEIAWTARAVLGRRKPHVGPVAVALWFYMPRPARLIWKTKPMPSTYHPQGNDVDNMAKAVLDALTGIAWVDDRQVVVLQLEKRLAEGSRAGGRLDVKIRFDP